MNEKMNETKGVYFIDHDRLVIVVEAAKGKQEKILKSISGAISALTYLAEPGALPADEKIKVNDRVKEIPSPAELQARRAQADFRPAPSDRNARIYEAIKNGGDRAFAKYADALRSGKLSPDQARGLSGILGGFMAVRLAGLTKEELSSMSREEFDSFCRAYVSRSDRADYEIYVRRNNIRPSDMGLLLYLSDKYRRKAANDR